MSPTKRPRSLTSWFQWLFSGEPGDKRRMRRELPCLPMPWKKFSEPWFSLLWKGGNTVRRGSLSIQWEDACETSTTGPGTWPFSCHCKACPLHVPPWCLVHVSTVAFVLYNSENHPLLNVYHVPGTVLSAVHSFTWCSQLYIMRPILETRKLMLTTSWITHSRWDCTPRMSYLQVRVYVCSYPLCERLPNRSAVIYIKYKIFSIT